MATTTTTHLLWILAWSVCCIFRTDGKVLQSVDHQQISDSEVLVTWQLSPGQPQSWNYKVIYTYRMVQIGDCQPLLQSEEVSREVGLWQRTLRLSGLQPWRGYRYKLKAPAYVFREEDLLTGLFLTRPVEVPRRSVQRVQVQGVSGRSADVSWQEPSCVDRNGPLRRFDVQLTGPNSPIILNAYTGLYVTLNNLQPRSTYMVRIRYVNSVGPSPFTSPVNFTTSDAGAEPTLSDGRNRMWQDRPISQRLLQDAVPGEKNKGMKMAALVQREKEAPENKGNRALQQLSQASSGQQGPPPLCG